MEKSSDDSDNCCQCDYQIATQTAKCWMSWCCIPAGILTLLMLISSIISIFTFLSGIPFLQAVVGWDNDAIVEVYPISNTQTCPEDLELFVYQFGGFKDGCDCGETCSQDCSCSGPGCVSTQKVPQGEYSNWVNQNNFVKYCTQTLLDVNFWRNYPVGGTCTGGEIYCGDPAMNDYGICVPSGSKCPITYLTTDPAYIPSNDGETLIIDPVFEEVPNTNLWAVRQQSGVNPIGNVKANTGRICFDNIDQTYSRDYSYSYLLNNQDKLCEKGFDQSFVAADTITAQQFWQANQNILSTYPGMVGTQSNPYSTTLWQRGYVLWKNKCRNGGDVETVVQQAINYFGIFKSVVALIVFSFILLIFLIIFPIVICCEYCRGKGCCCIGCSGCACCKKCWNKKNPKKEYYDYCRMIDPLVFFFFLLHLIFLFCFFITSIVAMSNSKTFGDFIQSYKGKNCSNSQMNKSLDDLADMFELTQNLERNCLIYAIIFFFGELILFGTLLRGVVNKRRQVFFETQSKFNVQIPSTQSLDQDTIERLQPGQYVVANTNTEFTVIQAQPGIPVYNPYPPAPQQQQPYGYPPQGYQQPPPAPQYYGGPPPPQYQQGPPPYQQGYPAQPPPYGQPVK